MTTNRAAKTLRRLVWLSVALALFAAAAIVVRVAGLRSDALDQTAREQMNLALVVGQQISASNHAIDRVLDRVVTLAEAAHLKNPAEFRAYFETSSLFGQLRDDLESYPQIGMISVLGDDGIVVASSRGWPAEPRDDSSMEDFQHLRVNDVKTTYVGIPQKSVYSTDTYIRFARRLNAPDGRFLGVVHVGMDVNYFSSIYPAIADLKDRSLTLLRNDGQVLFRYPEKRNAADRMPDDSPWRAIVAAGGGNFRTHGRSDGAPKIVSAHPIKDYPMVVDIGETESDALAVWRVRALQIALVSLAAFVCAGLLLRETFAHFRRSIESEAAFAQKSADLETLNARFAAVLGNMPQGVALFSADRRLIIANARYAEMYGLAPEDIKPGARLDDILALRVAKGIFVEDSEHYVKTRMAQIASAAPRQSLDRLSNGKIVFITAKPFPDGGWLTVHEDVTARQLAEDRIEHLAHHDQLTGAANRSLLLSSAESALAKARAGEFGAAILLIDLDEFKALNDTHGHPFGDEVLREVTARLRALIAKGDLVARIGGDEFAILQVRCEPGADAGLANRILERFREPLIIDGIVVPIRTSLGVARAPENGPDVETLMKNADLALYSAKQAGGCRVCVFEPSLEQNVRAERILKAELAEAVASEQFEVHYQTIVEAKTGEVADVEALVRWRHPTRGMVPPAQFINLAEQTGLIQDIGEFVLRRACREAAAWPDRIGVSVNLSPTQFVNGKLVATISDALAQSGLSPSRLTLEVTESALMENLASSHEILVAIRELGVRIALDDFGTGYSSLSYLQAFPLDVIKIDRSFVAAMETNVRTQEIVALIVATSRCLGARTVAEGVETQAQRELVVAAGCDRAQGYLFAKPQPIEALVLDKVAKRGAAPRAA